MLQPNQSPRIVFGPYEYDGDSSELRKHGTRLRLAGQPLRILEILLDAGGLVVGREEIQRQLWNGTTFVDFEHGLNAAINKLRQTLGDSADRPRYIETVAGRGYRFIGAIQPALSKPVLEMPPPPQIQIAPATGFEPRPGRVFFGIPMKTAVFGMALLAVTTILVFSRSKLPGSRATAVTPQTVRFRIALPQSLRLSGSETFSLSPDGGTLVYRAAGSDGVMRLWAQRLNSLEPKVLPGTESSDDPPAFWSPDSKQVAFYANGTLKKTDLNGGAPQMLCAVPGIVHGGSWNREGVIIFGPVTGALMRVSENGGTPIPITALDPARRERNHLSPTFLPDGRHFVYSRLSAVPENSGVYLGSLDASPAAQESHRLTASAVGALFVPLSPDNGQLLYQRENTLWARKLDTSRFELTGEPMLVAENVGRFRAFGYFGASESGALVHRSGVGETMQLAWFDRRGNLLSSVGMPVDLDSAPVLSPDGTRFAVTRFDRGIDIWVYDLARDVKQRLTSNPAINAGPVWSPDGTRIAFSSSRAGHYDLYRTDAARGGAEQLLYASSEAKFPSSWSRDGRFLLFQSQGSDLNWDISLLPLDVAVRPVPIPLIHTQANEHSGVFSPDGKWIAYVSDQSGTEEVYVQRFALPGSGGAGGGPEVLVSHGGGGRPRWRADGKELFYRASDGLLMSVAVRADTTFRPSPPQPLFRTPADGLSIADATAEGSRFLIATRVAQAGSQTFTVVLNWQSEVNRFIGRGKSAPQQGNIQRARVVFTHQPNLHNFPGMVFR